MKCDIYVALSAHGEVLIYQKIFFDLFQKLIIAKIF